MDEPGAPATTPAATPEASVHPGINNKYFEETKIRRWRKRFEREGREVYDHRDAIITALALTPGAAVADIGAGTGLFTILLARAVGPKGHVYAVDLMPHFLEHINAQAEEQGLAGLITTVQAEERSSALAAGSVDVVFTSDAYHHIEFPRAYLASIHAGLRPGGLLYVIDYDRVEGESDAWLLEHVRAGKQVVVGEIESAGFALEGEVALADGALKENYFLRFRRSP